ncbi:SMI1/KNR4 family protein [Guptibacillus hwajinpoensis]|uniref:SMI1/KNR4 family protein n=1 Tax=Guptibacillus hwajinpoensis TaxID=208199 RepID=UPI001CFC562B|nr:SMI1/KNR4 family protein [Pseudalkalibacillus hwajinpoensis]WLR59140.1 SMI1/KNR4 family protein [Pseudalkalibacillus hwajinpoensis]
MSIDHYHKAKKYILNEEDIADFVGGRSNELIQLAEQELGFKFTGAYLDFLKTFGAGNFGSQEIYGIIDRDFENSAVPDAIWYTLTERKNIYLPNHLLVIYDSGFGELYCLDFNQLDDTGEPQIVSFDTGVEIENQIYEVIANDFGDFLLDLVMEEME